MLDFYIIAVVAFLAAVSPGPDFVVVAKHAVSHSRQRALMASLGIGAGILVHSVYCVLGLAVVISQSLLLFSCIKYLGAAYLIYLGIKSLWSKSSHLAIKKSKSTNHALWPAFRDGLLANVLNPKATLFMLSVFTLVIKPHTPTAIQAIYGLEIAMITCAWFVFLSFGLTTSVIKSRIEKFQHIVTKAIGVVLVTLGIAVLFEQRS